MASNDNRPPSDCRDGADETLPARTHFSLDAEHWAAFQAALEAPARSNPALKKLLQTPSVFERRRTT
jgi:uncharacterized protein (DUF1778 family)